MTELRWKIRKHLENPNADDNVSRHEIIEQLNTEEVTRLIPLMVYLCLIIVTGILGNGLVCYIYRSKYDTSSSRWFIFFLGVVDLIMCVVIIPFEVATTFKQYNFKNTFFCQLTVFFNLWSLLSLGLTLVVVSIDRYRKVCKPLGWQINFERARALCVAAVLVACLLSLPVFGVYGIYNIEFETYNVTAHECSFRNSEESNFAFWYVLFGIALFTCALLTICVLYCFIGSEIKQHTRRENMKRQASLSASMAPTNRIVRQGDQKKGKNVRFTSTEPEVKTVQFVQPRNESTTSNDEQSMNMSDEDTGEFELPVAARKLEKTKSRRFRRARARKATFSMFLISMAFVISYLPFLCLLMARSLDDEFDENLSDAGRAVYKFFLRSYFFNCAINPFIYGISDSRFRDSCTSVITTIFRNCRTCVRKCYVKEQTEVQELS